MTPSVIARVLPKPYFFAYPGRAVSAEFRITLIRQLTEPVVAVSASL